MAAFEPLFASLLCTAFMRALYSGAMSDEQNLLLQPLDSTSESSSEPIKRKRGRPRKNPEASNSISRVADLNHEPDAERSSKIIVKSGNENYVNRVQKIDAVSLIRSLENESIHLLLSDIPYGISLDSWDVLHNNTNSALLGSSPAQEGLAAFKRRGKPINGWNAADKEIPKEYQEWCNTWISELYSKMKPGASGFIFCARRFMHRVTIAFEDNGFLVRDIIAWEKPNAHYRAQSLSKLFMKRGQDSLAVDWEGWRLGNLAPIFEPILWVFKPYPYTIVENVELNSLGAMNTGSLELSGRSAKNIFEFGYEADDKLYHEAQKPLKLIEALIKLTTIKGQIVLDPFMGSWTTAVAARNLNRNFIGAEINEDYCEIGTRRLSVGRRLGSADSLFDL